METTQQKNPERLAYNVSEAAEVLGLSRPTLYQLMGRADFPAFKIGRRTLISADGLRAWVQRQAEGNRDASDI